MLDECYNKAIQALGTCSTKYGLYASGGVDGYRGVWARDSMISLIGACSDRSSFIREQFKKSLFTLSKYQGRNGEIANAVYGFDKGDVKSDFQSIDSSLWFLLGHIAYKKRYSDNSLFKKQKKIIDKTLQWLKCQDMGNNGLLAQLPTTDWQDAFPHKYGYTINTHALYYSVLQAYGLKKDAYHIRNLINNPDGNSLWQGEYYAPWRWKNHRDYKEIGDWFDTLGNLLAIVFSLCSHDQALKILNYMKRNKIHRPFPAKAIFPPMNKGDKEWHDYYEDCDARQPNHYLNGGIWPYIGGFYVLSLIRVRKFKEAEIELKRLAKANLVGQFPEWIDPITTKHYGCLQAWNAGTYIAAYNSLKRKRSVF
jgi:glycogen debranching enzyme